MITDADIRKMKAVFVTKEDLKQLSENFETKFATKDELKIETGTLNKKIDLLDNRLDSTVVEVIKFIGEVKNEIMKELNDFRGEVNEFRNEMRDINRSNQSTLNNHEARIVHLEL